MKRLSLYLAVTAAALAFGIVQQGAVSAEPEEVQIAQIDPDVGKNPQPGLQPQNTPCSPRFVTNNPNADKYYCRYHGFPRCKNGYIAGKPQVVKSGQYWVIRYSCTNQNLVPKSGSHRFRRRRR